MAEPVVISHHHRPDSASVAEHQQEVARRGMPQSLVKLYHAHIHLLGFEMKQFLRRIGQQQGLLPGRNHAQRMVGEGDNQRDDFLST